MKGAGPRPMPGVAAWLEPANWTMLVETAGVGPCPTHTGTAWTTGLEIFEGGGTTLTLTVF